MDSRITHFAWSCLSTFRSAFASFTIIQKYVIFSIHVCPTHPHRPNVGKSTLINALLNDSSRLVVSPRAHTTRDSITIDFQHEGRAMKLIDTAGLGTLDSHHPLAISVTLGLGSSISGIFTQYAKIGVLNPSSLRAHYQLVRPPPVAAQWAPRVSRAANCRNSTAWRTTTR
jgi:hypothetical protein